MTMKLHTKLMDSHGTFTATVSTEVYTQWSHAASLLGDPVNKHVEVGTTLDKTKNKQNYEEQTKPQQEHEAFFLPFLPSSSSIACSAKTVFCRFDAK